MFHSVVIDRNIALAYFLVMAKHSWFWLGIWVFFYLRFTDYTGIGLIETVLFLSMTLLEIPTGAIADLLGKKVTLLLSFLIQTTGAILMAYTLHFPMLVISVMILAIGGSLYSGTLEAFVYDTLKQKKKENHYPKVLSNMSSIQFFFPAVCSVIGGIVYTINPQLPFLLNASFYAIATIATFFLTEPRVDSDRFSFQNFIRQTKQGFSQLTQSEIIIKQVILMLSISTIMVVVIEMLDSMLSVEFGFNESQIGILWAVIYVVSSFAVQLTPWLVRKFSIITSFIMVGIFIGITLLVSPWAGLFTGGLTLLLRSPLDAIFRNIRSIHLNSFIEPKHRATTLSTYHMINNIPYSIGAVMIGYLADIYSAKGVASVLGVLIILLLGFQVIQKRKT